MLRFVAPAALALALACTARGGSPSAGQVGGACRGTAPVCDAGLACSSGGQCFATAAPCSDYDCGVGACEVVDDAPTCVCEAGSIHASAAAPCREVELAREPKPGEPGGKCLAPDGHCGDGAVCNLEENYCFVVADPCVGFACGGIDRGRCEPDDGLPSCLCDDGLDDEQYALYCCPRDGSDPYCR